MHHDKARACVIAGAVEVAREVDEVVLQVKVGTLCKLNDPLCLLCRGHMCQLVHASKPSSADPPATQFGHRDVDLCRKSRWSPHSVSGCCVCAIVC